LNPVVIVAVGRVSGQWLLDTDNSVGHMASRIYRLSIGDFKTTVIPIHHPAYFLRKNDPLIEQSIIARFKKAKYLVDLVKHDL